MHVSISIHQSHTVHVSIGIEHSRTVHVSSACYTAACQAHTQPQHLTSMCCTGTQHNPSNAPGQPAAPRHKTSVHTEQHQTSQHYLRYDTSAHRPPSSATASRLPSTDVSLLLIRYSLCCSGPRKPRTTIAWARARQGGGSNTPQEHQQLP